MHIERICQTKMEICSVALMLNIERLPRSKVAHGRWDLERLR
jgi:hypothetical protein